MSRRWKAICPRERKSGKTFWHQIGMLFESDRGKSFATLHLDSLPIPDEKGEIRILFFEDDSEARGPEKPPPGGSTFDKEKDDEIPF